MGDTIADYARLAWFAVAVLGTTVVAASAGVTDLGPRWLWAIDACPQAELACGQLPPGPLLLAVPGAAVGIAGWVVIAQIERRVPEVGSDD